MLADGRHRGILVVPRDPGGWGNQVASAFARELTLGGGSVIAEAIYDPADHDYSDELRSVLRTDDSEQRHQRLERILGTKLNFEPRHRGDIEFVFIVPYTAVNARLIEPQLRYFVYAGDIPSYSISNAYEPDSTDANRDIDGLIYPDMPWMISANGGVAAFRSTIGQAWGNARGLAQPAVRLRLRCLPADAGDVRALAKVAEVQIDGPHGTAALRCRPPRAARADLGAGGRRWRTAADRDEPATPATNPQIDPIGPECARLRPHNFA